MPLQVARRQDCITLAAAQVAASAAIAEGARRGVPVVACVVDAGGDIVACLRADGAFSASVSIARDKAYTASVFGLGTDALCAAVSTRDVLRNGIAARPGVILFGGGLPVTHGGAVIGGIGVSGGSEDDDRACAQAGLDAIGSPGA